MIKNRVRKFEVLKLYVLLTVILFVLIPRLSMAQADIEAERAQRVQSWLDTYGKGYSMASPVLERIRSEHEEFYGKFGDALTALDIYIKLSNAQYWQAAETAILAGEAKMIDHLIKRGMLSSSFKGTLTVFAVAKTAMELFKAFVFDPYLMNDAVDRYYGMREIGNEPGDAIAIIGAIGNIRQQLLQEFRKVYGDLVFSEIAPSGLTLLPAWEERFQQFSVAFFENAYAQKKFEEMKQEAEKQREELHAEVSQMERQMEALLAEYLEEVQTISISPAEVTVGVGETVEFTVVAKTYGGEEKNVTEEALSFTSFLAEQPGTQIITAEYGGQTATTTVIIEGDVESKNCGDHGNWSDTQQECICDEGYEPNETLGCISLDEAIEEIAGEDEGELCDESVFEEKMVRLNELAASGNRMAANFLSMYNRFIKEINDQSSHPCGNSIIAYTYAASKDLSTEHEVLADEITDLSTEILSEGAYCPMHDVDLDFTTIMPIVSQTGTSLGQIERGLADMENQLLTYGCDTQEVEDQGNVIADRTTNPDVIESGGIGTFGTGGSPGVPGGPGGSDGTFGGVIITYSGAVFPQSSINVSVTLNNTTINSRVSQNNYDIQQFNGISLQEGDLLRINASGTGLSPSIILRESDFIWFDPSTQSVTEPGNGNRIFVVTIAIYYDDDEDVMSYRMQVILGQGGIGYPGSPGGGRILEY